VKTWDEMTEREQLECTHYEMHKDTFGFRNHSYDYSIVSDEELQADMARMAIRMEEDAAEEKRIEEAAIARFEAKLSDIQATFADGHCDGSRARALQWLLESLGEERFLHDADYACFEFGLPYGYLNKEEMFK